MPRDRSMMEGEMEGPATARRSGITLKGIFVGAVFSILVGWWGAYGQMVIHASPLSDDYFAAISLFLFFVVAAGLNGLLKRLIPKWKLNRADLTAIFVMLLAAAAIPTRGFVSMIGPVVTGSQYFATPVNDWGKLVTPLVIEESWLVPQGDEVIKYYYEGLPKGVPIPWRAWALPVLSWLALCLGLSFVMICVAVLFRKQWVERERIVYPLMQLPMEMARSGDDGENRPVWHNRLLWIGFAIPFLLYSYQGLAHYFPGHLDRLRLWSYLPMFDNSSSLRVMVRPTMFALLYFCRSDVLTGLAVFPFLVSVSKGFMKFNGYYPQVPKLGIWSYDSVEAFFGGGALLIFVARMLFVARRHLKDVFCSALGIGPAADDSSEIMSYRTCVFGLVLGGAFLVSWLVSAGMAVWQATLYFALAFTIFLALGRMIAEAGLPLALPPMVAGDFMVGVVGAGAFSAKSLTALGFTYPFHAEMRCFLLCHCSNGLKIAHDSVRSSKRRLLAGILIAVSLTFLVAMAVMIYFPYRDGGLNLDRWTFNNTATYSWTDASKRMLRGGGPILEGFPLMAYGAILMVGLLLCAHWIPFWPLNPGALVVSFHWAGQVLWLSAVLALVTKSWILKYGGAKVFTRSRPFFYGLILGDVVTASVWVVLDGLIGTYGNYVTAL